MSKLDVFNTSGKLVLKTRPKPEKGERGEKYQTVSELGKFSNTYGPYLGSLAEGEAKFFISKARDAGGFQKPDLVLRKSISKETKSEVVCGLFYSHNTEHNIEMYKGVDRNTNQQYLIGVEMGSSSSSSEGKQIIPMGATAPSSLLSTNAWDNQLDFIILSIRADQKDYRTMPLPTPFSLMRPEVTPPRTRMMKKNGNPTTLRKFLSNAYEHGFNEPVVALDIETKGNLAHSPDSEIVGIGFAHAGGSYYVPTRTEEARRETYAAIAEADADGLIRWIGHNVLFDGTFLSREMGTWLNWYSCTYLLYRFFANEGYPGQKWGLKNAQKDILKWKNTNEADLDLWLINNGFVKSTKKKKKNGYYWIEEKKRYCKPEKAEMWQAPDDILGYYCCLDAEATYLFFMHHLLPLTERFPAAAFLTLGKECPWMNLIQLLGVQQMRGVHIDGEQLQEYHRVLSAEVKLLQEELYSFPEIRSVAEKKRLNILEDRWGKEPARFKKDGNISKNFLNYSINLHKDLNTPIEEIFNLNSSPDRQRLFYEECEFPVNTDLLTKSGQPATNNKARMEFGAIGEAFNRYEKKNKELGYVNKCLEKLGEGGVSNTLHLQSRAPGTVTLRLAGAGGLNYQQVPKTRGYLECWKPREGFALLDGDHTSLEKVVQAELTKDASLWELFSPEAKVNDIYLYNASAIPGLREKVIAAGYDRDNPTPEMIAQVKKKCKTERGVSKVITLGSDYGMGPKKMRSDLKLRGIVISSEEAFEMYKAYWRLYAGVKEYESELIRQLKLNKGWFLSGLMYPICVAQGYEKDIVNRGVQNVGHMIHVLYVYFLRKILDRENIEWYPWIIDWHDQSIIEVKEEQAERAMEIMLVDTYKELNEFLNGAIPFKGDGSRVNTLADAKLED